MDTTRILSGDILVSKGSLKNNSSLPEVGLKDVIPNGSWLEQKQTQAALEARKHFIEVERIEKSGVLSHAEWHEELMLVKVTQKVGGHWQYIGHNVGKQLYLNPEEALFLMEVNCLLLKHNEVKVSLQQAYALLLQSKSERMKYKVYASLSRLGYKVYRHQAKQEPIEGERKVDLAPSTKEDEDEIESQNCSQIDNDHEGIVRSDHNSGMVIESHPNNKPDEISSVIPLDGPENQKQNDFEDRKSNILTEQTTSSRLLKKTHVNVNKMESSKYIKHKIHKLKRRNFKALQTDLVHRYFELIPDFTKNRVVTIKAADKQYMPALVVPKNSRYVVDIDKICTATTTAEDNTATPSPTNESTNVMYGSYVRHTSPNINYGNSWTGFNLRFTPQTNPFRYFNYWRPQTDFNYFHLNMTFQRPFQYPQFGPRLIMNPALHSFFGQHFNECANSNINHNVQYNRKRIREQSKKEHFDLIQKLAMFVKKSILELRVSNQSVSKLKLLLQSYNVKYKKRLRLSDDFTLINDENIIDTIELDEECQQAAKRCRIDDDTVAFNNKLQRLKQLAKQLKNLKTNHGVTSRHRRMFSKLLKSFNNCYNVDYYVDDNFDVINRNDLTVNSSSSDTEEANPIPCTSKKLKNPFSILKQLSDRQTEGPQASTSTNDLAIVEPDYRYSKTLVGTFKNGWLPNSSDFGRPEIVSTSLAEDGMDARKEELIFDFIKIQPDKFSNWLDIKISFLHCLQQTSELFNYGATQKRPRLNSLVKLEDFNNAATVLEKLNIINNNKEINGNTNLALDFDVYNRDTQNFKKSNRPLPHFRVICIRESSTVPSREDVANLHSKYKDNVTIIFAVVGTGSISYVQANPVELPIYISSNNNTV